MGWSCDGEGRRNSFAIVAYLPDPLGPFVDSLRKELTPQYRARAHITILPPRALTCPPDSAWQEVRASLRNVPPFQVRLEEIRLFSVSDVIYISIGAGFAELEAVHRQLNQGSCGCREAWLYHPHVTLGQQLDPSQMQASLSVAAERWRAFTGPRSFLVDHLTFVQNTEDDQWVDLADIVLQPEARLSRTS